jgi:hypothetical protein
LDIGKLEEFNIEKEKDNAETQRSSQRGAGAKLLLSAEMADGNLAG